MCRTFGCWRVWLFTRLARLEHENSSLSKEEVLEIAINEHYEGVLQGLVERIKDSFLEAQDPFMLKKPLPVSLGKLVIGVALCLLLQKNLTKICSMSDFVL